MKTDPGSLLHLMPLDEAIHQISSCMALPSCRIPRNRRPTAAAPIHRRCVKHVCQSFAHSFISKLTDELHNHPGVRVAAVGCAPQTARVVVEGPGWRPVGCDGDGVAHGDEPFAREV